MRYRSIMCASTEGPVSRTPPGRTVRDASPGIGSPRQFAAVMRLAAQQALRDQIADRAAAVTYYGFLALPSLFLVALGTFALVGEASAIDALIGRLDDLIPAEASTLLRQSLERTSRSNGVVLVGLGGVLALWTASGAMSAVMRALNAIRGRDDRRGFLRSRVVALEMLALSSGAFLLVFGLLVMGSHLSGWVGDAIGWESAVQWIWWVGQWPILAGGLLLVFATLLYLGPDVEARSWSFLTAGSVVALAVWLAASAGFSFYVSQIGSYSATWGALGAVVVLLIWLWLSTLALLLGAEIDAELDRRGGAGSADGVDPRPAPVS